jgi:hypothetical protein
VLADGEVVGRILMSLIALKDAPWFWNLAYGQQPTHGTAATCKVRCRPAARRRQKKFRNREIAPPPKFALTRITIQ